MNRLTLCACIFLCAIFVIAVPGKAEHTPESNDAVTIAYLETVNPESISGIRFSFELARRQEFDHVSWKEITSTLFTYVQSLEKNQQQSNETLFEVVKTLYDLAQETDYIDGNVSIGFCTADEVLSSQRKTLDLAHQDDVSIQIMTITLELKRDETMYDAQVWRSAVLNGVQCAKQILEDVQEDNFENMYEGMKQVDALLRSTSWARGTIRISFTGDESKRDISTHCLSDDDIILNDLFDQVYQSNYPHKTCSVQRTRSGEKRCCFCGACVNQDEVSEELIPCCSCNRCSITVDGYEVDDEGDDECGDE